MRIPCIVSFAQFLVLSQRLLVITQMEIAVSNPLIDLSLLLRIFLGFALLLICVIVSELRKEAA